MGAGGVGDMGDNGQKVQTPNYNTYQLWGCKVQHGDYSNNNVLYILKLLRG